MSKVYEVFPDGWVEFNSRGFRMACCDCGLVHKLKVRKGKNGFEMKVDRDNRSTALLRRHHDHDCKPK